MVRTPSCDKSGLRKGTWTPEEDRKLIAYVTRYGSWNWRQLPRFAGLARCGKSCRLRWMNYLRPNLKRGNFTQEEEDIIIRSHTKLGNRWSAIAAQLPGRTDNEIKNHWHTTLKRRFQQNEATNEEQPSKSSKSKDKETTPGKDSVLNFQAIDPAAINSQISDSSSTTTTAPLSPLSSSSSEFSFSITSSDHSQNTAASNENLLIDDDFFSFLDGSFWTEPYLADVLSTQTSDDSNNNNHELVPSDDGINGIGAFQSTQDTTTTQIFDACASFVDLENEFGSLRDESHIQPTVESFWTQPVVSDVSHVPSEYFSPLGGADLWGNQIYMYDEYISLL